MAYRCLEDPELRSGLPDRIEDYFDVGQALCLAFNRRGTLLAAGTAEGEVVIYDFDTYGVAKVIHAHRHPVPSPVTSVSWSRNGKYILTGSADHTVALWPLLPEEDDSDDDGAAIQRTLPAPVQYVCLQARPADRCLVGLANGSVYLLDLKSDQQTQLSSQGDGHQAVAAVFSKHGDYIYLAGPQATITVLDSNTLQTLDVIRVPNDAAVTSFTLGRKGDLLASCADGTVRLYKAQAGHAQAKQRLPVDAEEVQKAIANQDLPPGSLLHDSVEALLVLTQEYRKKLPKKPSTTVNGNGYQHVIQPVFGDNDEHIATGVESPDVHTILVYHRETGSLAKVLEGPNEGLQAIAWHPLRRLLLSLTASGRIMIWSREYAEQWSALAPGFTEIPTNTDYIEREDEFDWNTPKQEPEPTEEQPEGDPHLQLDIFGDGIKNAFTSDEEDADDQLHHVPVIIQLEEEVDEKPSMAVSHVGPGLSAQQAADEVMMLPRIKEEEADSMEVDVPAEADVSDAPPDGVVSTAQKRKSEVADDDIR